MDKAAVRHSRWGGDGGLRLRRGVRPLRRTLWDDGVSRRLRTTGISPRARGDQRQILWILQLFYKKLSKNFNLRGKLLFRLGGHRARPFRGYGR